MQDLIINGVPLRDPLGKYGVDYTASTFLSDASRLISGNSSFGMHGERVETQNWFGTSRKTLVINILGDTITEHNQLLEGWQGLLSQKDFAVVSAPQRSPLAAGTGRTGRSFSVANDLQRTARARMVGNASIERLNEKTARLTAILENISGVWSSVDEYTSAVVSVTAAEQNVDLSTLLGGSNGPVVDGKIRIKGPLTANGQVVVYDQGTSRGIGVKVSPALVATEYVIIDLLTMKASLVTSDVWTGGSDVTPRVVITGDGQFSLDPKAPISFPAGFAYGATISSVGYTSDSTAVQFRLRRSTLS